jgi:spermidine synthase
MSDELFARCSVPNSDEYLELIITEAEYIIKVGPTAGLMSSLSTESEKQLGIHGCKHLAGNSSARVLVAGLGMGFTLAAALQTLDEQATVVVSELVPEVVEWNRNVLGHLAGHPLADTRVEVKVGNVVSLIRTANLQWNAILLDCDNGPKALVHPSNDWLYSLSGLTIMYKQLFNRGVLAVWAGNTRDLSNDFRELLLLTGFIVQVVKLKDAVLYIGRKAEQE